MKRLIVILSLVIGTTLAHGQGPVIFNNLSPVYNIFTNSQIDVHGNPTGSGTRGPTTKVGNQFYYALLIAEYTGSLATTNPLDPAFTFTGLIATNGFLAVGSLFGPGGAGGTAVPGWGAATGPTYDTAERNYFLIVGWSANLGNNWASVSNRIATDFSTMDWIGDAFYGVSQLGNGYSGGGPFALPPPSLFGVQAGMPGGLSSGFDMHLIPEPTTFTLATLGAAAMLIVRRRKSR
jgi:PEP-CTERM motif